MKKNYTKIEQIISKNNGVAFQYYLGLGEANYQELCSAVWDFPVTSFKLLKATLLVFKLWYRCNSNSYFRSVFWLSRRELRGISMTAVLPVMP